MVGPVALAARYASAAAEALVGGDLYETVAPDATVRLIIGDVRGKGLAAVRTPTIVLGESHASAVELDDLGDVARQIDLRVRAYLGDEDFVSAIAEISDDGTFRIASCGHPPALLAAGGRITAVHAVPTLPLGLGADPTSSKYGWTSATACCSTPMVCSRHATPPARSSTLMGLLPARVRTVGVRAGRQEHLHEQVGSHLGDDLALLDPRGPEAGQA